MAVFNSNNRGRDNGPMVPPAPPQQASSKRGMFSVLGPDVTVTGNVTATADLHIDGRVEGDVNCGTLAQGSDSQIFGQRHRRGRAPRRIDRGHGARQDAHRRALGQDHRRRRV